jgi:hypothetical protein
MSDEEEVSAAEYALVLHPAAHSTSFTVVLRLDLEQ